MNSLTEFNTQNFPHKQVLNLLADCIRDFKSQRYDDYLDAVLEYNKYAGLQTLWILDHSKYFLEEENTLDDYELPD